ncbi:hypothetical protein QTP88_016798 [Uroleucon formosanum]
MWSTSGENFAIKHHTNKTGFPPGPQPSGAVLVSSSGASPPPPPPPLSSSYIFHVRLHACARPPFDQQLFQRVTAPQAVSEHWNFELWSNACQNYDLTARLTRGRKMIIDYRVSTAACLITIAGQRSFFSSDLPLFTLDCVTCPTAAATAFAGFDTAQHSSAGAERIFKTYEPLAGGRPRGVDYRHTNVLKLRTSAQKTKRACCESTSYRLEPRQKNLHSARGLMETGSATAGR